MMTTSIPSNLDQAVAELKAKGAKEILKTLQKFLKDKETKQLAAQNSSISDLISTLTELANALSDMYSPNILRFMTNKDAYIKELVASANQVQEYIIPNAINAAQALTLSANETNFSNKLLAFLIAFKMANQEKQVKIDQGKGDMVENTTHDIMKKNMKKNFSDVADLVSPIIHALQTEG